MPCSRRRSAVLVVARVDPDVVGAPVPRLHAVVGGGLERRGRPGRRLLEGAGHVTGVALDAGAHDDEVGDHGVHAVTGDFDVVAHGGHCRARRSGGSIAVNSRVAG